MSIDVIQKNRDLRRCGEKTSFDGFFWVAFALLAAAVTYIFYREAASGQSDIYIHAVTASGFNFLDLHSITERIAYPFWHVNFAVLYQLGVPLAWAAAIVTAVYKMLGFMLVQRIIYLYLTPLASAKIATLAALAAMVVTGIRIPTFNSSVYIGIGSPTVWHNPTQIVAVLSSLLCVFYTAHVVYLFWDARSSHVPVTLPWKKVVLLAVLVVFSATCKPTFLQAFLPACAIFFLVLWIKNPKHTRYFLQIILAFLPAVLYFLMQYLYYTGVVVPFTSGVAVSFDLTRLWEAVRNMLMMAAFPLFVLLLADKKETFRDPVIILCLLIAGISVLEAALFTETGVRENHGNFNWASMNAAFLLWVVMLPRLVPAIYQFHYTRLRLQEDAKKGVLSTATLLRVQSSQRLRSAGFFVAFVLLLWHVYSGLYYLYYLFSTGSVF
ncbi:MAG TPA: hypothetical protein PK537_01905 [Candidatus Limiplasma sp.]|nr:hypothetical protein [Candidatus Limiplasma sp.]